MITFRLRLSPTLSLYFARHFLIAFAIVLGALSVLGFVLDAVELLRRASGRTDATFDVVMSMALLRQPVIDQQLLPFIALFGSMLALSRLNRANELTVTRAAGISVWQFLAPALILAFLIGSFTVTVINPIGSAMLSRFEQLEARFLRGRTSLLAVSGSGLWLRESDGQDQIVVHALRVSQNGLELAEAILFFYEGADRFVRRIDASRAYLRDGFWELEDALISSPNQASVFTPRIDVPTTLTIGRIQDSFAAPETLSFWALPGFIDDLEKAGFSATRHRLHFQSLLAMPILLCAMVLIAATFSMRLTRRGGTGAMMASGVAAGFVLYAFTDLVKALGLSGNLPVTLAAWAPASIGIMLGLSGLFHLEDG